MGNRCKYGHIKQDQQSKIEYPKYEHKQNKEISNEMRVQAAFLANHIRNTQQLWTQRTEQNSVIDNQQQQQQQQQQNQQQLQHQQQMQHQHQFQPHVHQMHQG